MVNSVHFLLTYACNFECDHCFLFSGPAQAEPSTSRPSGRRSAVRRRSERLTPFSSREGSHCSTSRFSSKASGRPGDLA